MVLESVLLRFTSEEKLMNSKERANKKYHGKLKSVIFKFNPDNEQEMKVFQRLSEQKNKKQYISNLITEDMK